MHPPPGPQPRPRLERLGYKVTIEPLDPEADPETGELITRTAQLANRTPHPPGARRREAEQRTRRQPRSPPAQLRSYFRTS